MVLSMIFLVPVLLITVWLFFRFSPRKSDPRPVFRFNLGVFVFGLLVCAVWTIWIWAQMVSGPDHAWWSILAVLGSLAAFPVILLAGALVRNFMVFRD